MPRHVLVELIVIAVLLPCVALLAFWYIPASITEHGGFGSGSEVSPRFTPYLIAFLMAAAMLLRLTQLGWLALRGALGGQPDDLAGTGTTLETQRGLILNGTALLYGFVLIPLIGFYTASLLLVGTLIRFLGERRLAVVALATVAVTLFIYALFEWLLGVRLPKGLLGGALRSLGL
jgi:hypothetical protein